MSIAGLLELSALRERKKSCLTVAVIGSGGKTTLLWLLARTFKAERVLVSTSTKMWQSCSPACDALLEEEAFANLARAPTGVTVAANVLGESGKMGPLSEERLASGRRLFDYAFIEADGSRNLPYKGWAGYEPVVPSYADMTVAVMPVPLPGCRVTERTVHRLPLFCAISGASPGDALLPEHLASAVAHPQGLLSKARGRVALFFNQAEGEGSRAFVEAVIRLLPDDRKRRTAIIAAGSAMRDTGYALYPR